MFNNKKIKQLNKEIEELRTRVQFFEDNIIVCDECKKIIFKNNAFHKKMIEEREIMERECTAFGQMGGCVEIGEGSAGKIEICVDKYFCPKCAKKYKNKK